MYKISGIANASIFPKVDLITIQISNSYIILYNSAIKILYVIHLHFIQNQYIMFALLVTLVRQVTYLIYYDISLLFTNKKSTKITNYNIF